LELLQKRANKKILYLSYYFEPDIRAGLYRSESFVQELAHQVQGMATIDVIATQPNLQSPFNLESPPCEEEGNYTIKRIAIPNQGSGVQSQLKPYLSFYRKTKKLIKNTKYDLVVVSTPNLLTAYLGYSVAKKNNVPLYLDIRDLLMKNIEEEWQNSWFKRMLLPRLFKLEKKVLDYAAHINLISGGFIPYFEKFVHRSYSTFPDGIDGLFLNISESTHLPTQIKTVTYSGNIGEEQGLHQIIPQTAKELGSGYRFKIIGDGSKRQQLIDEVTKLGVNNVEILPPINREALKDIYNQSDFLFMHLDDAYASETELPVKIFELAAFDKPIIAGVTGFAREFMNDNVVNSILFNPNDVNEMVKQLNQYTYKNVPRREFIWRFSKKKINAEMAAIVRSYL